MVTIQPTLAKVSFLDELQAQAAFRLESISSYRKTFARLNSYTYARKENLSMQQVTRVTIALPRDLWENIKHAVPAGKRSGLVAQALENELRRRKRMEQFESLREHQKIMLDKYGELPESATEIEQMRQEHDDEQSSLR